MAGRRRPPKAGQRRMDAAIDHFVPMGYNKADVRKVINDLLKNVYGDDKGWRLLEENCYFVVQEVLFEKQEQEEKLQLQVLQEQPEELEEAQEQEEMLQLQGLHEQQQEEEEAQEKLPLHHVQQDEWEDDDEDQQQEAALTGPPSENDTPLVKVHNEVPSETLLAVEQTEELVPMIIDPPAPKAALPHPAATGNGRTRRPCYGWISESESDSDYEEFLASRQQQLHVPSLGGDLSKSKRLSRWDVK